VNVELVLNRRMVFTPRGGPTDTSTYDASVTDVSDVDALVMMPVAMIMTLIRHWEVTARVQKGFLSLFSSFLDFCLLFLIFLLTWASMFGLLGASVEVCTEVVRVRAST
jgi:hypothetical protein